MIRVYLRASTKTQDARRAERSIIDFLSQNGLEPGRIYLETASGSQLNRPLLTNLIEDSRPADILLVEQIDRLTRLNDHDWQILKTTIKQKKLKVVSLDLPVSWQFLMPSCQSDINDSFILAINDFMLDILAVTARKNLEDMRRRQLEGFRRARTMGKLLGRQKNETKHKHILSLRGAGISINKTAEITGMSRATVTRVWKEEKKTEKNIAQ